jgi:tetratricopeptide (TPR) repeat protein/glycosyltransferase involved in cell wall biosynthesis
MANGPGTGYKNLELLLHCPGSQPGTGARMNWEMAGFNRDWGRYQSQCVPPSRIPCTVQAKGKRILVIHPEGNLNNNANLTGIIEILCEIGFEVDYVAFRKDFPQFAPCSGTRMILCPPNGRTELDGFVSVDAECLKKPQALRDLITGSLPTYDLIIGVDRGIIEADLIAKLTKTPYGLISYEIYFREETGESFKQIEINACKNLQFAVCQDHLRGSHLVRENQIEEEKLIIVPFCGRHAYLPGQNQYLRKKLGIGQEKKIALVMGSLSKWTMIDYVIHSLRHWPEHWALVVHGRYGLQSDETGILKRHHRTKNLFVSSDPVERPHDMMRIIQSADVGLAFYRPISGSIFTGNNIRYVGMASGKIATYLQYGLPVIINEIGEMSEYVRINGLGTVADTGRCFSPQIIENELESMRGNCHNFYRRHLDLDHKVLLLLKKIDSLTSGPPRAGNMPQIAVGETLADHPSSGMAKQNFQLTTKLVEIDGRQIDPPGHGIRTSASGDGAGSVSIVLPTCGKGPGLSAVLDSLPAAMRSIPYEILLYTKEKSPDINDLVEKYAIQKVYEDRDVFSSREKFSWSRLMNHGFSHASGEWIMYASDDIVFHPDCFSNAIGLMDRQRDEKLGGIAFLHRNSFQTFNGFFKDYGYDALNLDKLYINYGLIQAEAFKKTGGFDEHLKFYWADVDICMQIWNQGYAIRPSSASLIDHHNDLEKQQQDRRNSLFELDTEYFCRKWGGSPLFGTQNPLEKVRYYLNQKESDRVIADIRNKSSERCEQAWNKEIHIVVDGVIFQLQAGCGQGVSRVMRNLIPAIARQIPQANITVLQRHGSRVPIQGVVIRDIPAFHLGDETILDNDDEMLHHICRDLEADLFFSTYYTRAPGVTNMVMIHDMIPEILGHDLSNPEWVAKRRVIETADAFLCVSHTTRNDLIECYPQVAKRPVGVAYNALDDCFKSENPAAVMHFQNKYSPTKPFLLMVGNRHGYKSGTGLLRTLANLPEAQAYSIICIGGEAKRSAEEIRLQSQLDLKFIGAVTDRELKEAYSGARAVLVPSKYEGFGLPVIEAMACGCPVIARKSEAVFEVAGGAVCYADPENLDEIKTALNRIEHGPSRSGLIARGRQRAQKFDWLRSAQEAEKMIQLLLRRPSILLTAIVSTYNSVRFIGGCLKDLQDQSLARQLEIIVVDSASPQDEASVVKGFQGRHPNIKYIRSTQRENIYAAWNRGIKFALGKYITNANTDDRHRRDALEQMVNILEAKPDIDLVYADVINTQTPNETFENCTPSGMLRWHDWDRETLLAKGCFIGPQPVWRRRVHDTYGYFDERYRVCGDFEFWLRISQTGSFFHVRHPLGLYLERPDSIEHANKDTKVREERQIIAMYKDAAANGKIIDRRPSGPPLMGLNLARKAINKDGNRDNDQRLCENTAVSSDQGGQIMYSPETILDTIRYLAGGEHRNQACWFLDKLITDYPDMAAAHSERAVIAYMQDDMERAQKHYELAAELAPDSFEFQKNLGDFRYAVQKDGERAIRQYEKALALEPNNAEVLTLAGHLAVSLHRFDKARQYYTRAVSNEPNNTLIRQYLDKLNAMPADIQPEETTGGDLYAIALERAENGDRQGALSSLKLLIERDARNASAHNDLGVLYYEVGEKDKALTHYQVAVRLAPENAIFQKNIADLYWVGYGDARAAMARYMEALKLDPQDVEAMLAYSRICMGIGKNDDARDFLDCILNLEPWNEEARQMMSRLETAGPNKKSKPDWGPMDLPINLQYDSATQDVQASIDKLLQTITESPEDARAFNDLGVLYFESGDNDRALYCYEQAVRLRPREDVFAKNLADFYLMEQGRVEDALKLYVTVLEDHPQDVDCLIATGLICRICGKMDDAYEFYQSALEIEPWNQSAREALDQLNQDTNETHGQPGLKEATA